MKQFRYQSRLRWACTLALVLAMPVQAQYGAASPQASAGPVAPSTATLRAAAIPWAIPATVLIGMPVVSQGNVPVGVVRDLVVDTEFGRVPYAILALERDYLGVENRALAFPLTRLLPVGDVPYALVANLGRRIIAAAPGFDANRWPDFGRDPYLTEAARYFFGTSSPFRDSPLVPASRMLGAEVMNSYDTVYQDDIGEIRDLGIDLAQARVRYMAVEYDPGWNRPEVIAMVPREDLSWEDNDDGRITYQTSRYDLRRAPAVAEEAWPQIALQDAVRRNFEEYAAAGPR